MPADPAARFRPTAEPCNMGMRRLVGASKARMTDAAAPVTPPATFGRSNGETVMDAVVKPWPKAPLSEHVRQPPQSPVPKPTRAEAEAAVRTLIAFAGDYPDREGLVETPKRVVDAYEELYRGYRE